MEKGRPVNCANMTGRLMNIFKTLKICTQGGKVFPCMFMEERERRFCGVCLLVCVCACDMKAVCLCMYICLCVCGLFI